MISKYLDDSAWLCMVQWSCKCGGWTASEAFAVRAEDDEVCSVIDGCGGPLVKRTELHVKGGK